MSSRRRVTLRAEWLGRQLREMREATGVKMSEAGEYLRRDASAMSRFETGVYPIPRADVQALLDFYGVNDERRRNALLNLSEETWRTDWWDGYADEVEGWFVDYVWLESRASAIQTFDVTTIYGLLQTPEYARAVIRGEDPGAEQVQIDRWVELRLRRQAILERSEPPRLFMIVDEAVLWRKVGGAGVLAGQLRHLADRAARPNIEFRVLPFESGAHASPAGHFNIVTLTDPYPEVVFVESSAGALYLEPPKTERFVGKYDQLCSAALDAEQSVDRVTAIAEELESR